MRKDLQKSPCDWREKDPLFFMPLWIQSKIMAERTHKGMARAISCLSRVDMKGYQINNAPFPKASDLLAWNVYNTIRPSGLIRYQKIKQSSLLGRKIGPLIKQKDEKQKPLPPLLSASASGDLCSHIFYSTRGSRSLLPLPRWHQQRPRGLVPDPKLLAKKSPDVSCDFCFLF